MQLCVTAIARGRDRELSVRHRAWWCGRCAVQLAGRSPIVFAAVCPCQILPAGGSRYRPIGRVCESCSCIVCGSMCATMEQLCDASVQSTTRAGAGERVWKHWARAATGSACESTRASLLATAAGESRCSSGIVITSCPCQLGAWSDDSSRHLARSIPPSVGVSARCRQERMQRRSVRNSIERFVELRSPKASRRAEGSCRTATNEELVRRVELRDGHGFLRPRIMLYDAGYPQ